LPDIDWYIYISYIHENWQSSALNLKYIGFFAITSLNVRISHCSICNLKNFLMGLLNEPMDNNFYSWIQSRVLAKKEDCLFCDPNAGDGSVPTWMRRTRPTWRRTSTLFCCSGIVFWRVLRQIRKLQTTMTTRVANVINIAHMSGNFSSIFS
jgi:hypothetical protein